MIRERFQTAASLLRKLLSVDGAGSGLDADKLDGLQSATAATANTVAVRGTAGRLQVGSPASNSDAVTLSYLTNSLANKKYNVIQTQRVVNYNYYGGFDTPGLLDGLTLIWSPYAASDVLYIDMLENSSAMTDPGTVLYLQLFIDGAWAADLYYVSPIMGITKHSLAIYDAGESDQIIVSSGAGGLSTVTLPGGLAATNWEIRISDRWYTGNSNESYTFYISAYVGK